MLALWDGVLANVLSVMTLHNHLARAALDSTEADSTVDFRNDRRVIRATGFKKFRHPWQTTSDVAVLANVSRNLDENCTGANLLSIVDDKMGSCRNDIPGDLLSLAASNEERWAERTVTRIDDDLLDMTCLLVRLLPVCDVVLKVLILHNARMFGDDDRVVRIPFINELAFGHLRPVLD